MATRQVLLSVDDDAAASRAPARDLRRRYGETHRSIRAENGPAAASVRATGRLRTRVASMRHKLGLIADAGLNATRSTRLLAAVKQYPSMGQATHQAVGPHPIWTVRS